jgi:hypothetical protein
MQETQLCYARQQKEVSEETGEEKALQVVQQAYRAQRDQVTRSE